MRDLEALQHGSNQPEFSVSEISFAIKNTMEGTFSHVRVRGEISGFKRHTSGHLYFSLKDEKSVLNCVAWRGSSATYKKELADGVEMICTGRISTFPGRSNYQLVVESVEVAGLGALMALLEKRKQQLMKEGLFDEARKKALPSFPSCIGVITSPTGAVIKDILHRLEDRFPVHVILWPVAVQGEGAAEQVTEAIDGFNNLPDNIRKPDVIIVARGGGSIEDLWTFNEEIVVRAAARSKIPLISAVGHETDTTLIDFASDMRAPTPTAAAEIATPVRSELLEGLMEVEKRMFTGIMRYIEELKTHLKAAAAALLSPRQMLENMTQKLDDFSERLVQAIPVLLERKREKLLTLIAALSPMHISNMIKNDETKLKGLARLLDSFHYEKVLERGFALIWDNNNKPITSTVNLSGTVSIQLKDGSKKAVVDGTAKKSKKKSSSSDQNSLF